MFTHRLLMAVPLQFCTEVVIRFSRDANQSLLQRAGKDSPWRVMRSELLGAVCIRYFVGLGGNTT